MRDIQTASVLVDGEVVPIAFAGERNLLHQVISSSIRGGECERAGEQAENEKLHFHHVLLKYNFHRDDDEARLRGVVNSSGAQAAELSVRHVVRC